MWKQSSIKVDLEPQSQVPQMLIGIITPALIASIVVLARLYSRAIIMKNWGYDDSWILFSWVRTFIFSLVFLY